MTFGILTKDELEVEDTVLTQFLAMADEFLGIIAAGSFTTSVKQREIFRHVDQRLRREVTRRQMSGRKTSISEDKMAKIISLIDESIGNSPSIPALCAAEGVNYKTFMRKYKGNSRNSSPTSAELVEITDQANVFKKLSLVTKSLKLTKREQHHIKNGITSIKVLKQARRNRQQIASLNRQKRLNKSIKA